ncbi:9ad630e2-4600-40fc-87b7-b00687112647 [Thermothielavioides terrestris]|uniref:Glycoside hydrolase family 125 protein n=2 Tax=Thermothielavioides terrestris TaxID=2587410 RepID=G2RF04_THETT|nr:uncharacterized protein THITE_2121514 [Thermothielavioides terrestris NRRL 8126]AEO70287.1 hypothetical protein THITE_2121514 [Thermothielavioides terrestris NRRL 8126]SPQ18092.1 9ad630e2-4600-40fc-87b7-b00687112647 [Thermothielavioides terrestris]
MGPSFVPGSRRGRLLGIALLLAVFVLHLANRAPLSAGGGEPFDLHKDPPKVPKKSQIAEPHHEHAAQEAAVEAEPAEQILYVPPTAETVTADVDNGINGPGFEPSATAPTTTGGETVTETVITTSETPSPTQSECPKFEKLQQMRPGPLSEGRRKFPYVRPSPECRTFTLPALEDLIERMRKVIRDPDLFRLFENSYPNTLDTMVKWRGYATKKNETTGEQTLTDEELAYVITGDIDAMWLRDSASQIYSYLPLLEASTKVDSLASLWRGVINSHSRYIIISPYCHAFQPPPESGIPPTHNAAYAQNSPNPPYDPQLVFDCKWELDSLASFLQISTAYYERTGDLEFFGRYSWVDAVQAAVDASAAMRLGTYDDDGRVLPSAWTFTGWTNRGTETLTNDGLGNPVKQNGMVRSAFRPSDDACIFQLLTPSNMMFAAYLERASAIMEGLAERGLSSKAANLTTEMRKLAAGIRVGIARDAVVTHRDFGEIFAYEVDGYGSANLMDDANVPSLLAMPLWNFTSGGGGGSSKQQTAKPAKHVPRRDDDDDDNDTTTTATTATTATSSPSPDADEPEPAHDYAQIYQNTRRFILSPSNPYFAKGPVLSAVGGPHLGPGKGWPMAAAVAGLTAFSPLAGFGPATLAERDAAVGAQLFAVLNSTAGTGVVHETVHAWHEYAFTRPWFGWANGLFGELVLRIARDEEERGLLGSDKGLLGRLWQD